MLRLLRQNWVKWPVDGEIRLLNKKVIPIPIDPREVEDITQKAQVLKEGYNTKIEAGVTHSELAQYSVDGCAFCEFKGACNTFWRENPQPIPGTDDYGCLGGRVLRLTSTQNNRYFMVVASEKSDGSSQEWQISNLSTNQFETLEELKQGTFVRLIDFKIDSDDSYRAKPIQNSVIWEVPEGL